MAKFIIQQISKSLIQVKSFILRHDTIVEQRVICEKMFEVWFFLLTMIPIYMQGPEELNRHHDTNI